MLLIWGRANSVNVQKVLWCCEEAGVAYERKDAGGSFGVVDSREYRQRNPNGLVPTIEDDGFVLWESNAIVRYLAARHAQGTLYPVSIHERARADQWMDWHVSTFWPTLRPLFLGLVRTPPEQRDAAVLEAARLATAKVLAVLDAQLERSRFAAGTAFTMADIALGCGVWRWMALPVERPQLAHVQRWIADLGTRDAYRKLVMHPLT
ncbi:MAG: glutathione S-transferase family protein [Casimicrobiaceae bacterium]